MKKFLVCKMCINDLQAIRRKSENRMEKLPGGKQLLDINCINRPRCFDQPERLSEKTLNGDAIV